MRRGSLNSVKTTEGAEFQAWQNWANLAPEKWRKGGTNPIPNASLDGAEERRDAMWMFEKVVE